MRDVRPVRSRWSPALALAFGLAAAALALLPGGCAAMPAAARGPGRGPSIEPIYGAPVVSIAIPREPVSGSGGGARAGNGATAVKVGPGLLLTAGHAVSPAMREAREKVMLVDGQPSAFEIVASGAFDAEAERRADREGGFRPFDGQRGEDWVLLRVARPSLAMAPYAEIDWDARPRPGESVHLVAPSERHKGGRGEGDVDDGHLDGGDLEVGDLEVGDLDEVDWVAVRGEVVEVGIRDQERIGGVIAFTSEDRRRDFYKGCSGGMLAQRAPGDSRTHASRWRMVGLFIAGVYEAPRRGADARNEPAGSRRVVHLAIPLPRELRAVLERERVGRQRERGAADTERLPPHGDRPRGVTARVGG